MTALKIPPVATAQMLIRRPAQDVYEAFVDPAITTKFWFTHGSGRLEVGKRVRWDWAMYGAGGDVDVLELEPDRRIVFIWSPGTRVDWTFTPHAEGTYVEVVNSGFAGTDDEIVAAALDSMGGFNIVLCAAKAWLEHGIALNVIADKAPDHHVAGWAG